MSGKSLKSKFQEFINRRKQSLSILVQLAAQSVPTFFILIFFSGSIQFAFILTAISVLVNFFRIKRANRPIKVESKFFPGNLTAVEYNAKVTFYVLGAMSKAKGRVTKDDIEYAKQLMSEFQLDASARSEQMKVFNQGRDGEYDLNEVIAEFARIFRNRGRVGDYFFDYQLDAAMQDGSLQSEERSILQMIGAYFGMTQAVFNQKILRAQASYHYQRFYSYQQNQQRDYSQNQSGYSDWGSGSSGYSSHSNQGYSNRGYYGGYGSGSYGGSQRSTQSQLQDAYDILGVKSTDDFNTVKKAYRRLIKQYHPDKYVSQDVPEAVKEQAKQKSQEVIGAYDLICKTKGWK